MHLDLSKISQYYLIFITNRFIARFIYFKETREILNKSNNAAPLKLLIYLALTIN